jgi:hypothetical protein
LVTRFGIQAAAATRDIAQYKELAPRNMEYDTKGKVYVRGSWFRPAVRLSGRARSDLAVPGLRRRRAHSLEGHRRAGRHQPAGQGRPGDPVGSDARHPPRCCAVEVAYRALSSGLTTREIVPFALADSGLRWHVRAFDRRSGEFRDFVLGRLDDARIVAGAVADHEKPDQDIQWNRITELELVPHPANVQHPDTIEAEYGMEGGVLKVRARAAMAGYLLRRWNVDCTEDHSLKGGENHLWLRNRQALYGVTNLRARTGLRRIRARSGDRNDHHPHLATLFDRHDRKEYHHG